MAGSGLAEVRNQSVSLFLWEACNQVEEHCVTGEKIATHPTDTHDARFQKATKLGVLLAQGI